MQIFEHDPIVAELHAIQYLDDRPKEAPPSPAPLTFAVGANWQYVPAWLSASGYEPIGKFPNRHPSHKSEKDRKKLTLLLLRQPDKPQLTRASFTVPSWQAQRYYGESDEYQPWIKHGVNGGCGFLYVKDPEANALDLEAGCLWRLPAAVPAKQRLALRTRGWQRVFEYSDFSFWTNVGGM